MRTYSVLTTASSSLTSFWRGIFSRTLLTSWLSASLLLLCQDGNGLRPWWRSWSASLCASMCWVCTGQPFKTDSSQFSTVVSIKRAAWELSGSPSVDCAGLTLWWPLLSCSRQSGRHSWFNKYPCRFVTPRRRIWRFGTLGLRRRRFRTTLSSQWRGNNASGILNPLAEKSSRTGHRFYVSIPTWQTRPTR